jgi:hypothetical protein
VETPHTFIIGGGEDQAYGPKALEIINLRGVSTKQNCLNSYASSKLHA